jgi:hypothetical protein
MSIVLAAPVDVSKLPGGPAVPDVRLRLRCSKCGKRPTESRPDWSQYRPATVGFLAHEWHAAVDFVVTVFHRMIQDGAATASSFYRE